MSKPTGPKAPPIDAAELRSHLEMTKDAVYLRDERRCEPFSRSLALPSGIDGTTIDARLEDGVLELTLPLHPGSETEPTQVRPIQ